MSMLKLTFYPVVHFVKYNAVRAAVYEFTRNSRYFDCVVMISNTHSQHGTVRLP